MKGPHNGSFFNFKYMTPINFDECIDACLDCAKVCQQCATACLKENNPATFSRCIELNITCATICLATAQVLNQRSDFSEKVCNQCAEICHACYEECLKHPELGHCQRAAEVCRVCEELCLDMTGAMKH